MKGAALQFGCEIGWMIWGQICCYAFSGRYGFQHFFQRKAVWMDLRGIGLNMVDTLIGMKKMVVYEGN